MGLEPRGLAQKGSQKWIQKLINENPALLNHPITDYFELPDNTIFQWVSPKSEDYYAEYRGNAFLDILDLKLGKYALTEFWPRGGPRWDALGKSADGKVFLVEAKSHITEMKSPPNSDIKTVLNIRCIVIENGPTVCVVDDDPQICKALGRLIKSAGFNVKTYGSAQELLDDEDTEGPDLLVLDVRMPGMNGLDLQNHLAASGYAILIVSITAHENGMARTTAMAEGAVDFFQKPFDEKDLLGAIYKALNLNNP